MGLFDRILGRRRRTAIGSAREGVRVEVSGKVSCAKPLVAPYTGRACVYWRLEFIQQQLDRVATLTAVDAIDFVIDDGSGRAEILVELCQFDVVSNYVEMERASRLSAKANALAMRYEWGPFAEIAQVNVREAIIAIGDEVEVEGSGIREPDAVRGDEQLYRDGASKLTFSKETTIRGKQRDATFIRS